MARESGSWNERERNRLIPVNCPTEEKINEALRIFNEQQLHIYKVIYKEGLTNPDGLPLFIGRRPTYNYGANSWITVGLSPFNSDYKGDISFHNNLFFTCKGTEPDEEIIYKAKMLIDGRNKEKGDTRFCCCYAERQFCVCTISFSCILHGRKCIGTHD